MPGTNLADIIDLIKADRVTVTEHAYDEAAADHLSIHDIFYSVEFGQVIEDYPLDKPYPRCLVLGFNMGGKPLHTIWAYNIEDQWVDLITVYCPDPKRWVRWRQRKHP